MVAIALLPGNVGKDDNVGIRVTVVDGGTVVCDLTVLLCRGTVLVLVGTSTALVATAVGRDGNGVVRATVVERGTAVFGGTDTELDGAIVVEGCNMDDTRTVETGTTVAIEGAETQTDTGVHGSEEGNAVTVLDGGTASDIHTDADDVTVALGTVVDGGTLTVALRDTGVGKGRLLGCDGVVTVVGGGAPASH